MMDSNKIEKQITAEEALEMPELAHLHEAIRYAQNTPFKIMFPNKHRVIMESSVKKKTYKLFEINPNLPLHKVVANVLSQLSDDEMSSELTVKLTQVIIEKWEKLSSSPVDKGIEELV
jgi:hypothetical protein